MYVQTTQKMYSQGPILWKIHFTSVFEQPYVFLVRPWMPQKCGKSIFTSLAGTTCELKTTVPEIRYKNLIPLPSSVFRPHCGTSGTFSLGHYPLASCAVHPTNANSFVLRAVRMLESIPGFSGWRRGHTPDESTVYRRATKTQTTICHAFTPSSGTLLKKENETLHWPDWMNAKLLSINLKKNIFFFTSVLLCPTSVMHKLSPGYLGHKWSIFLNFFFKGVHMEKHAHVNTHVK